MSPLNPGPAVALLSNLRFSFYEGVRYGRGAGVGLDRGTGVDLGVVVAVAVGVGVGLCAGAQYLPPVLK